MPIYRYKFQGLPQSVLQQEVSGSPTFSASGIFFVDITAPSGSKADLDDAMALRGWAYDSTDPINTPVQAEGATIDGLTFAAVNAALGAANAGISVNGQRITNLSDPTSPQDACTKAYADALKQGLDIKDSCRVATTSNLTSLSGLLTIDGVTTAAGDRVLVKNQTDAKTNGIYVVASGTWSRSLDADTSAKVTSGMFTFITEGTANADSGWVLTTPDPIVLGTTNLSFVQFSGAGQIVAGAGLVKTGNTIDIVAADGSIVVNADSIQVGVISDANHGSRGGGTLHATVVANGNAGFMSGSDKAKLDGLPAVPASGVLMWGNSGISTTTTTRYLTPGWTDTIATVSPVQFRVPKVGTIRNLYVRHNTVGAGSVNVTYTVRKNNANQALAVTMLASASDGNDTSNSFTVAAGDLIDVMVTKANSLITSPSNITAVVEYGP